MRSFRSRRRLGAVVAQAVVLTIPTATMAGVNFASGSAIWSWDADTLTANGGKTSFTIAPPSTGAMPVAPSYQLNKSGSFGSGNANGKGSIGYVTTSTTASFTLAGGAGAAQNDPNNDFPGETVTKVTFNGTFDVTSPGFGPTAVGFYSLQVAGTAGVGGYARVVGDMSFKLNNSAGANLRSPISFDDQFNGGANPTAFSKTYTYSLPFSPTSLTTSQKIYISGSLTFLASNFGSPSDLAPFNLEVGGTPPTATCYVPGGFSGQWEDPGTWSPPDNPAAGVFAFTEPGALLPPIPDGTGHRARFVNVGQEPRSVTLNTPVTLGSLDINDDGTVTIGNGSGEFTMKVNSGNASTFIGANFGNAHHVIDVPITLENDMDIRVESATLFEGGSQIDFNQPITNAGGVANPKNVEISGGGAVNYNSANDYRGVTSVVKNGTLRANADGSLGSGPVNVVSATLELNTPNPFAPGGGVIIVSEGGLVRLGVPSINGLTIEVLPEGGISGSPSVLPQVVLNSGVGSISMQQGFIGHEVLDPTGSASPQGLGTVPNYIYGLTQDVVGVGAPDINIGTAFATPWIGIGGDRGVRTLGADPTDPTTPLVTVGGQARIVSLGGLFNVNARIAGTQTSTLQIDGAGIVSLDSEFNTYLGGVSVLSGATLRVNGQLSPLTTLVQSGATLGGRGTITGQVEVAPNGTLDPGIGVYDNVTANLTVSSLVLRPNSILHFEFGGDGAQPNDMVTVNGDLTLDGLLVINQLQDFDSQDIYTLFTYTGTLIDNGLEIAPFNQEINGLPANLAASIVIQQTLAGGAVYLVIPEPVSMALIAGFAAIARRRRD